VQGLITDTSVERGVLHGQQSGAPDPLSNPLDQPQQPERQVVVESPQGKAAFRRCH
jgi:hypothetical protein